MTAHLSMRARLGVAAAILALVAGAAGYGIASFGQRGASPAAAENGRKILYWYDPMVPSQHFDKPGKSPFMDMALVPKYADEAPGAAGAAIDPARLQRLGARIVAAERGTLAGAPLADLLVPEWGGAQREYLAVRRTGDAALARAARQRLVLLGMPAATIAAVEAGGRPRDTLTVSTPIGGMIKTLGVRAGMTLAAGQTLAEINGIGTVWLNAAVPEALAAQLRSGQSAGATLTAFPGERFAGRVSAILPNVQPDTRTLTVRIELPNRGGRLRPGMFARVDFGAHGRDALLVPTEAVIRTGRRNLVMLALPGGRYQPAEVRVGAESGGRSAILAGLAAGEKIVASGQFLIDSEASLAAIPARPIAAAKPAGAYETVGRIDRITKDAITLSHQPVPALSWPAMTMTFRVGTPALARGFKVGDRVRFGFDQAPEGPTIHTIAREAGR